MSFDEDDFPPTPEDEARMRSLPGETLERIDQCLLSNTSHTWRKVARVIALTMTALEQELPDLPDGIYTLRVKHLAASGSIEAAGNLDRIRYSEIRLPDQKRADSK